MLAASKHIRVRPFAHFTSAPYRHAPKAERTELSQTGRDPGWFVLQVPPAWFADFGETPAQEWVGIVVNE